MRFYFLITDNKHVVPTGIINFWILYFQMSRKIDDDHQQEQQQRTGSFSKRLVGAPPSAAAMRIAGLGLAKELTRKRSLNANDTEESGEEDEGPNTAEEIDEEEAKNDEEEANTSTTVEKKRRRKKKRRIRLTDQGLKAKRKAERREKLLAEKKEKGEDDVTGNEDASSSEAIQKSNQKDEKEIDNKKQHPQPKVRPSPDTMTPFQLFCDYILRKLVLKDSEGYFTHPVSEDQAPDYREVIECPMDFSTIREKIEDNAYENIGQFRYDVELIIGNAQIYNGPGNLFYIAAQKLTNLIKYYFSEKYLTYLLYALPFGKTVPVEQLGLKMLGQTREKSRQALHKEREREKIRALVKDTMSTKEIMDSSPKAIKSRLTNRLPNCKLAYLDNRDGAFTLNVLTPTSGEEANKITLGDYVKPLAKGTPGIFTPFEPMINQDYTISYTNPGPYASFAPQYDSTWATLSKRDSDLLFSCYGDRDNVSDAFSLRQMVQNAGEHASSVVEQMLNEITCGEHEKVIAELEGKAPDTDKDNQIDPSSVDGQLMKTGKIIQNLATMQHKRLSKAPPATLTHASLPDAEEVQLANEAAQALTKNIPAMEVRPRDIVNPRAVHHALGLDMDEDDFNILSEFLEV